MSKSTKLKTAALVTAMAGAVTGLAGCASGKTACTVRHRYAIVLFQNGIGNNATRVVTGFRLNIRYWSGYIAHRPISAHLALRAPRGKNPPIVVRTYRVGHARSCYVDHVTAHQQK